MILTGKAKEDFLEWLNINYNELLYSGFGSKTLLKDVLLAEHIKNTDKLLNNVIIEWFDSVGIYISINYDSFNEEFIYLIDGYHLGSEETRTQATNSVIKIANDNYNKNFKL